MTSIFLLVAAVSAAHADPITPSYTVTDLGSQGGGLSTDANSNSIVINASGQTISPFPETLSGTWIPTPANFPLLDPVPVVGSYAQGFSGVNSVSLYPNGIAIAVDEVGVNNYFNESGNWQRYDFYYVQRNPDGSWGQPVELAQSTTHYGSDTGSGSNVSVTLSKSGDVLITTSQIMGTLVGNSAAVYNIYTHAYTDLRTVPALVENGYSNIRAFEIDDDGRILLWANQESSNGVVSDDLLLLTPAGISCVPEPGSWAVMAVAMAAFAAHRARERRRRSYACPSGSPLHRGASRVMAHDPSGLLALPSSQLGG